MIFFIDLTNPFSLSRIREVTNLNRNVCNIHGTYNPYKENNITFDICTPKLRCIPEHCIHIKMPRFTLAHLGPLQSKLS